MHINRNRTLFYAHKHVKRPRFHITSRGFFANYYRYYRIEDDGSHTEVSESHWRDAMNKPLYEEVIWITIVFTAFFLIIYAIYNILKG